MKGEEGDIKGGERTKGDGEGTHECGNGSRKRSGGEENFLLF